ncbi:MAG: ROK family protein [Lachnospiraceae bacterium]|nr:ROK family protein [Lachnospiraceae bacterium]
MLYGALEAGGTKMVCAVGDENGRIAERESIPTADPEETLRRIISFFADKDICALGVASFGPIDLDKSSPTYGYITSTPKLAWKDFDIVGKLKNALHVPVGFDTDVNGSLLGEMTWGKYRGLSDAVYITIGTGIGAGIMSGGNLIHGMLHPEAGHIIMAPHISDRYAGKCPYHKNCFEGMASGPAIEERWGKRGEELTDVKEVWELEAYYIAQALTDLIMVLSPKKIILSGGVMKQSRLFPLIRKKVSDNINGYLRTKELINMENFIVPASLDDDQGIMGCIRLAMDAKEREKAS